MNAPLVSVVLPVYNAKPFIDDAVLSILEQAFSDLELIIINDGSTDGTSDILRKYAKQDSRIKLIEQENRGLVASLNRGIRQARGKYIARQDADDRSNLRRLNKQVKYLNDRPESVLVGSSINVMNKNGRVIHQHALLLYDPELRQELLIRSPFAHGSVMFRRQAAIDAGLYLQHYWPAEDYNLWLRLSAFGQMGNLDEFLYDYREHANSIMTRNSQEFQDEKFRAVQAEAWRQRQRLLSKRPIKLNAYRNLVMGQLRIERIIDNNVFISKQAWAHGQKSLAFRNMALLAGDKVTYRKAAGKLKRKVKK